MQNLLNVIKFVNIKCSFNDNNNETIYNILIIDADKC